MKILFEKFSVFYLKEKSFFNLEIQYFRIVEIDPEKNNFTLSTLKFCRTGSPKNFEI